ncbi:hypothetical protein B0H13DRAFT_2341587 [Mycena leptocephala]|nr:hypothetical protein B0H13DRAFT_2341587 [Mycena leptocephala]
MEFAVSLNLKSTLDRLPLAGNNYDPRAIYSMTLLLSTPPREDPPTCCMDPAASLNLNTTLGAFQIGVLISYVLFGVTTTQTYIYYSHFPDDSLKLKALVAFVWVCEMAHVLCVGHTLYVYTISAYAHPERLAGPTPVSFETSALLSGIILVCVQGFFAFRIYAFSKKLHIAILVWVMAFFILLGFTVIFITAMRMSSILLYAMQWGWLVTALWSVSAANDLVIAATLAILLRNRRTDAHRRTAALVDKLILWSIETGILTSATSIVTLTCFLTMGETFISLASFVVGARVFSNSLLASLNSRATLRALNEVTVSISLPSLTPAVALPSHSVQIPKVTRIASNAEPSHVQSDKVLPEDV